MFSSTVSKRRPLVGAEPPSPRSLLNTFVLASVAVRIEAGASKAYDWRNSWVSRVMLCSSSSFLSND